MVILLPALGEVGYTVGGGDVGGSNVPLYEAFSNLAVSLPSSSSASPSSKVSMHLLQTGLISPVHTFVPDGRWHELNKIRFTFERIGGWFVSWVWGGRRESGFEVLERKVGKIVLGKGQGWWAKSGAKVWRVGAGCESSFVFPPLPVVV